MRIYIRGTLICTAGELLAIILIPISIVAISNIMLALAI